MENTDFTLLKNHIDEPIKKSVVGLALLGFTPIFSCCGFTYKGEVIRKDHFQNKSYIYLSYAAIQHDNDLKALLIDIAYYASWNINHVGGGIIDFHCCGWKGDHPWNVDGCLHKPEVNVIACNYLEKAISKYTHKFKESAEIRDGNDVWKKDMGLKYWQYDTSKSWVVNTDTFNSL